MTADIAGRPQVGVTRCRERSPIAYVVLSPTMVELMLMPLMVWLLSGLRADGSGSEMQPDQTSNASGLINLMRNLDGSIGI